MRLYFCVVEKQNINDADKLLPGAGKFLSRSQIMHYYTPDLLNEEIGFKDRRACMVEVTRCRQKLNALCLRTGDKYHVTYELLMVEQE